MESEREKESFIITKIRTAMLKPISCIYLFLTPNSRSVFHAGVSLNIHSFIHAMLKHLFNVLLEQVQYIIIRWIVNGSLRGILLNISMNCKRSFTYTTVLYIVLGYFVYYTNGLRTGQ